MKMKRVSDSYWKRRRYFHIEYYIGALSFRIREIDAISPGSVNINILKCKIINTVNRTSDEDGIILRVIKINIMYINILQIILRTAVYMQCPLLISPQISANTHRSAGYSSFINRNIIKLTIAVIAEGHSREIACNAESGFHGVINNNIIGFILLTAKKTQS